MSLGGGGMTCTICQKISYPAETILFDQRPFHSECFKCSTCSKKMEAFGAAQYEGTIYCKFCFDKGGFARKQAAVKWTPKVSSAPTTGPKLGGGGQQCTVCGKTAYPGECGQYDGKPYHLGCMRCSECSKECTLSNLASFDGKLFCLRCFEKGGYARKQAAVKFEKKSTGAPTQARFAGLGGGGSKCYTCQQTVYPAETILFEQRPYHAKCFRCLNCKKEMTVNQAEHKQDKVYCQKCFVSLGLHLATVEAQGSVAARREAGGPASAPAPAAAPAAAAAPVAAAPAAEPEPEAAAAPEPEPAAAPAASTSAEDEIAALKQKLQEQEIALLKQKLKEAEAKLTQS